MADRVRVRFAPSPTGYLHVGGARTALFNWLFARHHGGDFILRIEDTDRERSSDAMVQAILDGMEWLGLDWNEGPWHQADGLERHRQDALRLLAEGKAYRCFCTAQDLEAKRRDAEARKEGYRYDRHCAERVTASRAAARAAAGEPFTIRFAVPPGETTWEDAVHEHTRFDNADIEDFIILRTDGTPIYNLAVVSDDHDMAITHVIRGDDHMSNTPKQILLYRALGWDLPVFGHLPMILGPDGRRLSKRHGATAVGQYRDQGILPAALVNFLALLGWSPGDDTEIMTLDELVRRFSLDGVNKKGSVFDPEKLEWLNGQYLNRMSPDELEPLVTERLVLAGLAAARDLTHRPDWYHRLIELLKVRSRTLAELVRLARPFLLDAVDLDPEAVRKHWARKPDEVAGHLARVRELLADADRWEEAALEESMRALAEELGVGAGKLIHPLRVAVTGTASSPGIFDVLVMVGRERSLARVDAGLAALESLRAEVGERAGAPGSDGSQPG
jgi:glutamyl-tRNA synthetase